MAYYFKLPTYDDLNAKQKVAVNEEGAIALSGGPGTGKSVVSVHRHINNYKRSRSKSILLTYTKSLRYFLAQSIKSDADKELSEAIKKNIINASSEVSLANSWNLIKYDEIIIDEAQDLPENELVTLQHPINRFESIIKQINHFDPPIVNLNTGDIYKLGNIDYIVNRWRKGYLNYIKQGAEIISYGADDKQIVYPERATFENRLKIIFPNAISHKLRQNYRNTYGILNFVKYALDFDIDTQTLERLKEENIGTIPILKLIDHNSQQNDAILDIIKDFNDGVTNIAILLFFNNQFNDISTFLNNNNVTHSKYNSDSDNFTAINNVHLTTFKSSKGLEFDVVIIPEFNGYMRLIGGQYNVTAKDFYVAFTRAKRNLFLISNSWTC